MHKSTNILKDLVAIPSVFPEESKVAQFIEKYLQKLQFKITRHKVGTNRWNILAERGVGNTSLLWYGHMDTVPVYGNWHTDPFSLTEKKDKLYGLGACDMKGGIAALLAAVADIDPTKRVKLLFGTDEENISEGVWKVIQEKKEWFSDVRGVLVGEPGASATQTGGANVVTLGRRGRAVFVIDVFGKSVHGGHPEKGVNAITQAAAIAMSLEKLDLPTHPLLKNASLFVRKLYGESTSLSIPDHAMLEIDYHLVVPETIAIVKKMLEDHIVSMYENRSLSSDADRKAVVRVKERTTPYIEPYVTPDDDEFTQTILTQVRQFHSDIEFNYGKSVADDNIFANRLSLPVVTIGPEGGNIHSANEWVSEKSLHDVSALYKAIIEAF